MEQSSTSPTPEESTADDDPYAHDHRYHLSIDHLETITQIDGEASPIQKYVDMQLEHDLLTIDIAPDYNHRCRADKADHISPSNDTFHRSPAVQSSSDSEPSPCPIAPAQSTIHRLSEHFDIESLNMNPFAAAISNILEDTLEPLGDAVSDSNHEEHSQLSRITRHTNDTMDLLEPSVEPLDPIEYEYTLKNMDQIPAQSATPPLDTLDKSLGTAYFVAPYKSEQEMLDNESIDKLLDTALTPKAAVTLGDPSTYNLPTMNPDLFHFERDLRKIKTSLERVSDCAQRKYAKIAILKHYNLLAMIYRKYCKIGGDIHWLTLHGWMAMLRDARILSDESVCHPFIELFHSTYNYHRKFMDNAKENQSGRDSKGIHHGSRHKVQLSDLFGDEEFHDKDPWTGVWMLEKERERIEEWELAQQQREQEESQQSPFERASAHLSPLQISGKTPRSRPSSCRSSASNGSVRSSDDEDYFDRYKFRKIGDSRYVGVYVNGCCIP